MSWIKEIYYIFKEIQEADIFKDQKHFADCIPIHDLELIKESYRTITKDKVGLEKFVEKHFESPTTYIPKKSRQKDISTHIESLWSTLTINNPTLVKGSLIGVPHSYVLPGGRFREFYYWDSYFTMLGLSAVGKVDLIRSMVKNFSFLIGKFGFIPNGTRSYFLTRSQPPFYALMLDLLSKIDGEKVLIEHYKFLEKEYSFWMNGQEQLTKSGIKNRVIKLDNGAIGNRYYDSENIPRPESHLEDTRLTPPNENIEIHREIRAACESGWDFSSRWLREPDDLNSIYTTQIMPIDLNCLLFFMEKTLEKCYSFLGKQKTSKKYQGYAENRKKMINKYFWNDTQKLYMDYSIEQKKSTPAQTLATLYPLFLNIAPVDKAHKVLEIIEEKFLKKGGLVTTLCISGQQWDAPNAWAPLQYIGYIAAKNYGRNILAEKIRKCWMSNVESVYNQKEKLTEKYNAIDTSVSAEGGEYPNQDGFGWTNGVYLFFQQNKPFL